MQGEYIYPMLKEESYYIKILVEKAFEKPKNESPEDSLFGWCKFISFELSKLFDPPVSYKTLERMYLRYIKGDTSQTKPYARNINQLCAYIGFEDYGDFVNDIDVNLSLEQISYNELALLDRERKSRLIKQFVAYPERRNRNALQLFWLAVLLLEQQQYATAVKFLDDALEIDPVNAECHYNVALAKFNGQQPFRRRMDEINSILYHLDLAIQLNPQNVKFYYLKAFINRDYFLRRGLKSPKNVLIPSFLTKTEEDGIELKRTAKLLGVTKIQLMYAN
ncbi:MAG: hypothetical protein AAGB24_05720 [Bacteroidota bacterium]